MVARDFFEVLISYQFFSMTVLKVARKSIGERVKLPADLSEEGVQIAYFRRARCIFQESHACFDKITVEVFPFEG